jgi:hypothetical protein
MVATIVDSGPKAIDEILGSIRSGRRLNSNKGTKSEIGIKSEAIL